MPLKDLFTRKKNPASPAGPGGGKAAGNPVETMFESYKEADEDKIGPEVRTLPNPHIFYTPYTLRRTLSRRSVSWGRFSLPYR
jgi:hypothetical protein